MGLLLIIIGAVGLAFIFPPVLFVYAILLGMFILVPEDTY